MGHEQELLIILMVLSIFTVKTRNSLELVEVKKNRYRDIREIQKAGTIIGTFPFVKLFKSQDINLVFFLLEIFYFIMTIRTIF